jgi:hypothetical protein
MAARQERQVERIEIMAGLFSKPKMKMPTPRPPDPPTLPQPENMEEAAEMERRKARGRRGRRQTKVTGELEPVTRRKGLLG